MRKKRRKLKKIHICLIIAIAYVLFSNFHIINSESGRIIHYKNLDNVFLKNADCIIVLGAGVKPDGTPSDMLKDRLDTAVEAYKRGLSQKILMSGDHGRDDYDEVNAMKKYAIAQGIPSSDIFMDHAGFSTYDSMSRAKEIFQINKAFVVSQRYHLYRALYLANSKGIKCYGIAADHSAYKGQKMRDIREVAARTKDFLKAIFSPAPKFLGETIPVSGDGDITNDQ